MLVCSLLIPSLPDPDINANESPILASLVQSLLLDYRSSGMLQLNVRYSYSVFRCNSHFSRLQYSHRSLLQLTFIANYLLAVVETDIAPYASLRIDSVHALRLFAISCFCTLVYLPYLGLGVPVCSN